MKFGILTQYYPPEIGAPQARLSDLARRFAQRGHQVFVLTAMPSYPQGRIYPGYSGFLNLEEMDGVRVIRTTIYPTQKTSVLPRLASYFSFVISSSLLGGWRLPSLDYLFTESPPLFLGLAGYWLSHWKRARWIFNISDLWPESAVRLGVLGEGLPLRLSESLEAFCYRKAWAVTGQSRSILESIRVRFPQVKTYHFSNGVNTEQFHPNGHASDYRARMGLEGKTLVIYAGLHGLAQGLEQILQAAGLLIDLESLRILFIGDGPEKQNLVKEAAAMGLPNVEFLDPMPGKEMPAVLDAADYCVVPLKTYIPGAVPSKLYEAMACGRPVVFVGQGEAAEIVSTHQAGIVVEPGNIQGIADGIRRLANDVDLRLSMGRAGRRAVEQYYDRESIVKQFGDFLN